MLNGLFDLNHFDSIKDIGKVWGELNNELEKVNDLEEIYNIINNLCKKYGVSSYFADTIKKIVNVKYGKEIKQ